MDAVRAPDGRRRPVLERAPLEGGEQAIEVGEEDVAARTSCTLKQVSSTSDDVMPWWTKRASGPTCSARWVRKAMTSCFVTRSISSMRATSNTARRPRSQIRSGGLLRHDTEFRERRRRMRLDLEPDAERVSGDQMAAISGRE
jgi:hypothetical protein